MCFFNYQPVLHHSDQVRCSVFPLYYGLLLSQQYCSVLFYQTPLKLFCQNKLYFFLLDFFFPILGFIVLLIVVFITFLKKEFFNRSLNSLSRLFSRHFIIQIDFHSLLFFCHETDFEIGRNSQCTTSLAEQGHIQKVVTKFAITLVLSYSDKVRRKVGPIALVLRGRLVLERHKDV